MSEGESSDVPIQTLMKSTTLSLEGTVYRPLELFPPSYDFGYAPAERFLDTSLANRVDVHVAADSYGVTHDPSGYGISNCKIQIINMSLIPQSLMLRSISPEFTVMGRSWYIEAGEKLDVPIEFHPPREQIQYHGEIVFQHKFGTSSVHLTGTGASAEIAADEVVHFGNLKIGTSGQKLLQIHNRGLLETKYELDIIQSNVGDFRFLAGDPFECEGVLPSGGTKSYMMECHCTSIEGSSGAIIVKWRRIPKGNLERFTIPLKVLVGYPSFRMQNLEIDFKTTYIEVNKTLDFRLYNEGNASCNWQTEIDNKCLSLDVQSGCIGAGETIVLRITYAPVDFETLAAAIRFVTDAGNATLMCYGVVGVPYLKLPQDMRDIDFGIV
eukprot:jgi/Hompol1/3839/HPOL_006777-RA